MVTITASATSANIYETLYDSLTASLSQGTVTGAFITDTPTFPQVVINPAKVMAPKLVLNNANKSKMGEVEIEIFAKKNKEIDQLSDEIRADLEANESTLASAGLYLEDIEDSSEDTVFWNDNKIHTKTILVTFKLNI